MLSAVISPVKAENVRHFKHSRAKP